MKVNAMIIGAGRSGTTTLYAYLQQHPAICSSITKEVHYFSIPALYERGNHYFHSLFPKVKDEKVIATADTYLLTDASAPQKIRSYNPEMKFLIILREPVARAYSNFNYSVNFGHERNDISFLDTIALEPERLKTSGIVEQNNLCHFYGSLYYKHISKWMEFFPREQFLILRTDDMQKDAQVTMDRVFNFLGIQPVTIKSEGRLNQSSGAKSKFIQQVLLNRDHWLRRSTRFLVRPFRSLVIRSGIIERISKMNKKEVEIKQLTLEDREKAALYFTADLKQLDDVFGIRF